jgi:glycosyltransferase involved in cell wall biosynthesis
MAMGLPVVATPPPAQGIDAQIGTQWFVEESPHAFAARVVDLLEDPVVRARVGGHARRLVEERYAWPQVLRRVRELVEAVAGAERADDSTSGASRPADGRRQWPSSPDIGVRDA